MKLSTEVGRVVEMVLLKIGVRKATRYMSPEYVVKATRRMYAGKLYGKSRTIEIVVTIGKPNYEEREFIKKCKKVGEPFPVKGVQCLFAKGYSPKSE
jgi:hypothetical protein